MARRLGQTVEFNSFIEAGFYFARMAALVKVVETAAAHHIAHKLEKTAKDKFGHYQPGVRGRWPAWEQLADETIERKATGDSPLLESGSLRDSISSEVTEGHIVVGSPDERMIYHEFGTSTIPPRPVLGPTLYQYEHSLVKYIGKAMVRLVAYGFTDPPGD